jgi:hypothetical protein
VVTSSNEQLAKVQAILRQLDKSQGERPDNRRRTKRLSIRLPLSAILLANGNLTSVPIYTRNLSVSGIGFMSRRPFKALERIAIRLNIQTLPPRLILAQVTFGRYVSSALYEVGAEFIECVKDGGETQIPSHWLIAPV